jgi:hypothetical protein
MVDLKTIYEQVTASFDKIADRKNEIYDIEVFQQPHTPIIVYVYWNKTRHKLDKISFTN